jgi:hypothetical protein
VAARSTAWVFVRLLVGIVVSNAPGGVDVCLSCVLSIVMQRFLCRDDHSSRCVLPSVVCVTEFHHESSIMRRPCPTGGLLRHGKSNACSQLQEGV